MKNLVTYEDYLISESQRVLLSSLEINHRRTIFESFIDSPFVTSEEKSFCSFLLEENLWSDFLITEESLADRIKAKAESALRTAKEKGKEYLSDSQEKLLKMGGTVSSIIGKIIGIVKGFIMKAWEYFKQQVETGYAKSKEKITKAAAGKFKGKSDQAKEEIVNLKSMATGIVKWASNMPSEMKSGMEKASKLEESYILSLENSLFLCASEMIKESEEFVEFLREGEGHGHSDGVKIPFLSSLMHKLSSVPPFKQLHDIEHIAGDAANKGLSKISEVATKISGAPGPFEFALIGSIFALVTGYAIKSGATSLVKEIGASALGAMIVVALPGLGVVLKTLKYAAKAIWVVGICETALNITLKGDDEESEIETDTETKDKEEE